MQCMEIWGGNQAISSEVRLSGIDAYVYSRPYVAAGETGARSGGGDVHYLSSCATGRISRLIVADVSGHGGEVAPIATNLRRLMGRYSNYIDQSRFIAEVNGRFHELRASGDRWSGMFATAVTATYFAPTDELSISSAGHPSPIRYDGARAVWEPIRVDSGSSGGPANLPLGVLDDARFDQRTLTLGERDLVLIYTDAAIEVAGPDGRQLGESGLLGVLSQIGPAEPEALIRRLIERLAAHEVPGGARAAGSAGMDAGDSGFGDDLTLLVLSRNPRKPRPSPVLAARAGLRIAASAVRSIVNPTVTLSLPQLKTRSILGAMADRFNRGRGS